MKKNILLIALMIIICPVAVQATTGSTSCSSAGTVTKGGTITVTVNGTSSEAMWDTVMSYDSSKLQYVSGSGIEHISDNFVQNITYTYTFKAVVSGSAWVKTNSSISDYEGNKAYPSSSCNINIVEPAVNNGSTTTKNNANTSNPDLSSNNNLSSLSVENYNITPEFDRGTLEYSLEVPNNVDKIVIHAEAADSEASVSGWGEKELVEGVNEFNIVVTAENGSTRVYTILVTRAEKDPIKVNVNGEEYTVLRKAPEKIDVPSGFKETTIKIKGEEVVAYKDAKNKITLVLLADKKGKTAFYLYDGTNYSKFIETSSSLNLALLNINGELDGFKKDTITINGEKIEVLVSNKNNNFIIVKAINMDTMKEGYYIYDKANNSFIEYNGDIYSPSFSTKGIKGIMTSIKDSGYGIFIALGIVVVLLLLILALALGVKNKKLNKLLNKITAPKEEPKQEKIKEEKKEKEEEIEEEPVIEETKTIATEDALSEETIEAKENDEDEFEPLDDDIKPKPKKKKKQTKKKK